MKIKIILILLSLVFYMQSVFAQSRDREIVGYYPNWQWYDRNKLVNPHTIDYTKYTIINYCFMKPELDGSISLTDSWADENLLLGEPDYQNGGYIPNTSIIDLAHNNGVLVLPSIGGWTMSSNFPIIAADSVKRIEFASACVDLIQEYNFDGVDIDWEYPGYIPHGGTPEDKNNFSLLLQEIRSAIDNYSISTGKPMLLTAAVGASENHMENINWQDVCQYLDIINLMSYDFFGAFSPVTNHNSPLYQSAQGNPGYNIDSAVTKLIYKYGVSHDMITLGLAFYGRSAKTTSDPGLFVPTTGNVDDATFPEDEGNPLYYNILDKMSLFEQHFDNQSRVPYLTGINSLQTFVSYDNQQSIAKKAQYIIDNDLAGAIIWEITGDYIETYPGSGIIASTPLVDTLNKVLYYTSSISGELSGELPVKIFPNPTGGYFTIHMGNQYKKVCVEIMNAAGKQLNKYVYFKKSKIDIKIDYPAGIYFLRINTDADSNASTYTLIKTEQ